MNTPFADILRHAVEDTPGAVGGAFAACDGETVDFISEWERTEWAILTAHYGIVLSHVQSALHTFHFGEAELLVISHDEIDVLLQSVEDGYFALMVVERPASLGTAITALERATRELRKEMA